MKSPYIIYLQKFQFLGTITGIFENALLRLGRLSGVKCLNVLRKPTLSSTADNSVVYVGLVLKA